MFVSITSTREVLAGPDAEINCPACGEMNVPAPTRQQTERFYLYGLVLVQRVTATIVTCGACGVEIEVRSWNRPADGLVRGDTRHRPVTAELQRIGARVWSNGIR
jgi:predicted RNA-binding Zn-ribbon protein involved in translation (DUF1610 family)